MTKIPEAHLLRVTYTPDKPGKNPVVVDIERTGRGKGRDEATRRDAGMIADALLELVPGTKYRRHDDRVKVEHVAKNLVTGEERAQHLHDWRDRIEKPFKKRVHAAEKGLGKAKRNARKIGEHETDADWQKRGDYGIIIGKGRSDWYASHTWTLAQKPLRSLGAAAIASKFAPDASLLILGGLGEDTRDLSQEFTPGKSVEEMAEHFSRVLRELQNTTLDPADIVHGMFANIVKIIENHQSGLDGVALTLFQARIPQLREIIDGIFAFELMTSPTRASQKGSELLYIAAEEDALHVRKEKSRSKGHQQSKISQVGAHFGLDRDVAAHRLLYPPTSVVATELSRQAEKMDRIDIAYLDEIMKMPTASASLAQQRFRVDMSAAFLNAMRQSRTPEEVASRQLSGDTDEIEQRVMEKLKEALPEDVFKIIEVGLDKLKGENKGLPAEYRADVKALTRHEIKDSYHDYVQALLPLAEKYSQDGHDLPPLLQELWRQCDEYAKYLVQVEETAQRVAATSIRRARN